MIKEKAITRAVRLTLVVAGLSTAVHPALAQDNANVVQVTGTRITSPGITSNSPISSITAEEIRATQPVAVEEFFKALPSATPAIGPGTNNGTGGGATIDLRGLGANRSLVLVNGRRIVPFNLSGVVDTNSIPLALINRVDVLTGGASVVYGADAVAGVANFNLRRNFTGVEFNTTYGATADERDTKRRRTDITFGSALADGRGNVVLSLGKTKSDPLTQGQRDYAITSLSSLTGKPTGSDTSVPAIFSTSAPLVGGNPAAMPGSWQINPETGRLVQPVVQYNTNPVNYYSTGLDRTQVTALGNFRINDHAEVYSDVFYTNSQVSSTLASSGTFSNTFSVPIGNPYIPQAAREQICARRGIALANCVAGNTTVVPLLVNRRFTEMGPRYNNFDNKTLQYTVGVKGDLLMDWTYDAYWSRGTAEQTQDRVNWGSLSRVTQALNAVSTTACVNPANGCVPLNVFGAEGSITPEQIVFINQTAMLRQKVEQDVAQLALSGDLGQALRSPLAEDPISISLLAEHRKVTAATMSDAVSQIANEVLGTGAPTPDRRGTFSLMEYAIEAYVPLVKNKPFVRSLNAELGYRETSFKTNSKTNYGSWKAGGEWAPVQQFRVRGMVQKATRAPNVNELFAPNVTGLSNLANDPCQGTNIRPTEANTAGTLSNLCRLTGVPVNNIGTLNAPSAGQINNLSGGNPNLGPESAKTKTIGFVIEPLPRMALSVDYYKIDITQAVSSPSTTDILAGCYSAAQNPGFVVNDFCGMVGRNTINGTFNGAESRGVQTPQSNLGRQSTAGVDMNLGYRANLSQFGLDARYGSLDLSLGSNFVTDYTFQATPNSVNRDCLGYYSIACNNVITAPVYKRKFNQRTTWNVGAFTVGYNWRYVSAVEIEPNGPTVFLPEFSSIGAYHYVDLNANWRYNENLRFTLSVTNLADKKPPIVGANVGTTTVNSGNTFPQSYDAIGRYVTLGANLKF